MKKIINVKETMIIIISVILIMISTNVLATGGLNLIAANEYENAQVPVLTNTNTNTNTNANTNLNKNTSTNNNSNTKVYNTNNKSDLPQTGIEDYNMGILLIICVASAIFAYKKVNDYRNL